MLSWIKKRARRFEEFFQFNEPNDRPSRKECIRAAVEDWQWMTSGGMAVEHTPV